MDRLGGLIKWMPLTALGFLAGTLSIAALPPFNGFVSEWLTLQTMLRSAELSSTARKMVFALCGAGLALTAALAVTCFVKVFAMSFSWECARLRTKRKNGERKPESGALAPMAHSGGAVPCVWRAANLRDSRAGPRDHSAGGSERRRGAGAAVLRFQFGARQPRASCRPLL